MEYSIMIMAERAWTMCAIARVFFVAGLTHRLNRDEWIIGETRDAKSTIAELIFLKLLL